MGYQAEKSARQREPNSCDSFDSSEARKIQHEREKIFRNVPTVRRADVRALVQDLMVETRALERAGSVG